MQFTETLKIIQACYPSRAEILYIFNGVANFPTKDDPSQDVGAGRSYGQDIYRAKVTT